jgi:hypothetical protein
MMWRGYPSGDKIDAVDDFVNDPNFEIITGPSFRVLHGTV